MRAKCPFLGLYLSLLASLPLGAQAQSTAQPEEAHDTSAAFSLRIKNCRRIDEARLAKLLRLELTTLGWKGHPQPLSVEVHCFADSIALFARVEGYGSLDRLLEVAESSERQLALTGSELVAEVWAAGLQRRSAPQPSEPAAAQHEPQKPTRNLSAFAVAEVSWLGGPGRGIAGGALGGLLSWESGVHLAVRGGAGMGVVELTQVRVRQRLFQLAPELRLSARWSRVEFYGGAGITLGWASLDSESLIPEARGEKLSAPWVALIGRTGLRFPADSRWHLVSSLSVGGVLLPIHGEVSGETALSIAGATLGGDLGIGIYF